MTGPMMTQPGLVDVSTSSLTRLHAALASGRLRAPLSRAKLIAHGIREQLDALTAALEGHNRDAALALLSAVLTERARHERPAPELVWSGPEEGTRGTARDTAIILRELFDSAHERVILAGYSFRNAEKLLAPLHQAMQRGVDAIFFVDIPQPQLPPTDPEAALQARLTAFVATNWPFGQPYPKLYCDRRAAEPGPPWASLHAKCLAVDGRRAFISSANFTERAHDRNIEVGALIHDPTFTAHLERQWLGLIKAGLVRRWSEAPALSHGR
jgi:phosphatidylserine/phosphatidylglycerophosphate/cardiolipin synthase-like enzyme